MLADAVGFNTEAYDRIYGNAFLAVGANPLSTFSIDVDRASYSNVRRFIRGGHLPLKDAVRIEELINYFTYDYPDPIGDHPFSVTTEVATAPWNPLHKLVRIGLQGERIDSGQLPPSNLVFLIDVSGSMQSAAKLPLLKSAFRLLVNELREDDRVALVVYAGAAGLVLPPTSGDQKGRILEAIEALEAGGSTAGGAGLELAYRQAVESYVEGGNNRVILATDGDFNVGPSSDGEMVRLIEEKRELGVFLTVLGFGTGNLKDSKMEKLADKGNGNYAYIDNLLEAKKVLVTELGGTLFTIAKDVKLQVEFNPERVAAYRLIGYENRLLQNEDFADDKKDAGDIGAGHSVTALYEIVPVGVETTVEIRGLDSLRYQATALRPGAAESPELLFVKVRYKAPDAEASQLLAHVVLDDTHSPSHDFMFASAVAEFGMLLRDSEYKGDATFEDVIARAKQSKGDDTGGYRGEFIQMAEAAERLALSLAADTP
jgi:Ca-activated chloride channel family protein